MKNPVAGKNPADDKMMEKAVVFLVRAVTGSGHNPKPVILHSIRTGLYLYQQNQGQDVVAAAVLHDVIEDTDATIEEVEREFGPGIARLVAANSFHPAIAQREERDLEMLHRCKQGGKRALLIKAADLLDNSGYFHLCADEELSRRLLHKMEYFLELSSGELAQEPVWHSLKRRCRELRKSSGISK